MTWQKLAQIHTKRRSQTRSAFRFYLLTVSSRDSTGRNPSRFHAYRSSSLCILFRRISSVPFYPSRLSRRSKHEFIEAVKSTRPITAAISIFRADERVVANEFPSDNRSCFPSSFRSSRYRLRLEDIVARWRLLIAITSAKSWLCKCTRASWMRPRNGSELTVIESAIISVFRLDGRGIV